MYTHPWVAVVIARRKPEWGRTYTTIGVRLGWRAAFVMARRFLNNRLSEVGDYTITLTELA